MERNEQIETVKSAWRDILPQMTGEAKRKVNRETSFICPICGHGKGGDGLTYDPKSKNQNNLKCFSCGFSGSVVDLYMTVNNIEFSEALTELSNYIGIEEDKGPDGAKNDRQNQAQSDFLKPKDKEPAGIENHAENAKTTANNKTTEKNKYKGGYYDYFRKCAANLADGEKGKAAREYLKARGIEYETAKRFLIGFDPAADPANAPGALTDENKLHPAPRIITPCTTDFYIARSIDPDTPAAFKAPNPRGSTAYIFNSRTIYDNKEDNIIFICEGVFDALSFIEAGYKAIALNGKGNGSKLLNLLSEKPAKVKFVICPDNENTEEKDRQTKNQAEELKENLNQIGHYKTIVRNIAGEYHDANEAFVSDPAGFRERAAAAYEEQRTNDDLKEFLERVQTDIYRPYATGINFIDALYNGGPEAQTLNVIAAPPACGKTMLCCQIAESIAKQGRQVIYLNLEMSKEQLIARTLSARLKKKNIKIPAANIRRGYEWTENEKEIIENEIEEYRQENRPHYIGAEDISAPDLDEIMKYLTREAEIATRAGELAPVVFVDYLHLIKLKEARDLAETIKETCLQLKNDYAVKYGSIVFAILALNRESMKEKGPITLYSARDSSNIEYTADTFLTLDYTEIDEGNISPIKDVEEMEKLKRGETRTMTFRQHKDRSNGQAQKQIIEFEPGASIFHDIEKPAPEKPNTRQLNFL